MNGVHDMGGMHGMGPIDAERDEPVFHAPWEARALALTIAAAANGRWTLDAARHARERIPAAEYLRSSYYEKWIDGLTMLLVETGLVTPEELARGHAAPGTPKATPPLRADRVATMLAAGGPTARAVTNEARFGIGAVVRAKNLNPSGHTRLPRYARGKRGTVDALRGAHVFADTNAHFMGENPQQLYTVRFAARELWGETAAPHDEVCIDLWEAHLEPA
jgi:nitrile hydratase beta subunit